MPDSGDDAAMAAVNAAVEVLRLAMLHGRGRRSGGGRGARGGAQRAAEAESALAQAYDGMDGKPASQDFKAGEPGNVVFGVKTVEWDPSCEIVAGNLEELGVPFAKTVEGETAWFEIAGENAFAARALIDGLCEHVRDFDRSRVSNYGGLARESAPAASPAAAASRQTRKVAAAGSVSAPAAKSAADAVWRGVCATPEEAALVRAALAAHGIEHCGQADPETGAEEIFIAQSELDAKGYRIPRAIREMPGMPERLAALGRGAQAQGARPLSVAARGKTRAHDARFRPAEKLDRDLAAARAQAAAQAKDRAVPKVTRTRAV